MGRGLSRPLPINSYYVLEGQVSARVNRRSEFKRLIIFNVCLLGGATAFALLAHYLRGFEPVTYCIFYDAAHLYCLLCGGTRAFFSILRLDILSAIKENLFLVYMVVVVMVYDIKATVNLFLGRKNALRVPKWLIIATCALCLAFFLGRNLFLVVFGFDPLGDLAEYWR